MAPIAALIGDASRAAMLTGLMGGGALTAGELGLLDVAVHGRHRYFRLAGANVAGALETLATLAVPATGKRRAHSQVPPGLRFARSCYGHLAGFLAVRLRDTLLERGFILERCLEHQVSPSGEALFASLDVDVPAARQAKRSFARACLDWSERSPHLAGAVGDSLFDSMVDRGWLKAFPGERFVELTEAGRRGLHTAVGLTLDVPELPR